MQRKQRPPHSSIRMITLLPLLMTLVMPGGCTRVADQPKAERLSPPALADELPVGVPGTMGLNTGMLKKMLDSAETDSHRDLNSILVARKGTLVLEAYFNGEGRQTRHDIRSAGKSFTSTLVGLALYQGALNDLDQPVVGYFPEYKDATAADPRKRQVTIRHLLEMRSGFHADDDDPDSPGYENKMLRSHDWIRYALNVPMSEAPGKVWRYAGMNTMLLGDIVQRATGIHLPEYLETRLLHPLGIYDYDWKKSPKGRASGQGFLSLRARDMLKFGILFLQKGKWKDRQLVPSEWVHDATRKHTQLGYRLYSGYGYQWWTARENNGSHPIDFYFASGNGGQKIYVIPDADLVVVITSSAYNQKRGHVRSRRILREILLSIDG